MKTVEKRSHLQKARFLSLSTQHTFMKDVTKRILAFNETRIPKMRPLKYRLMQENVFRFFRGTCHLFYEDLAAARGFPQGPLGWICGDLHLENFGSYRSDNNQVYFDLNDFDEAILAPVTWEVVRLMTSIFIGFESLKIDPLRAQKMAKLFLKSYAATLAAGKADYVEAAMARGIICDFLTGVAKRKQRIILEKKASLRRRRVQMLTDNPKHFKLPRETKRALMDHVTSWLKVDEHSPYNYKVVDAVFRLAGTGSIGVERYAFLLKSLNQTGFKYILLDMKEAAPSSLAPHINFPQPAWQSEAHRVINAQRRMQNRCPALLSTSMFRGKPFIMQEMQPAKDSIDFRLLRDRYRDMYSVIDSMAILTASAQLRSSGQEGSATTDDLKAFGTQEGWQETLLAYAAQYARRVQEHYEAFIEDTKRYGLTDEAQEIEEEGKIAV
jgi:uncharacterized protein (DUF2252 family)